MASLAEAGRLLFCMKVEKDWSVACSRACREVLFLRVAFCSEADVECDFDWDFDCILDFS